LLVNANAQISPVYIDAFKAGTAKLGVFGGTYQWRAPDELVPAFDEMKRANCFTAISDPVGSGFVESLARPGRNTTGFTNFVPTMAAKWLEVLKEIAPQIRRAVLLFNPQTAHYLAEKAVWYPMASTWEKRFPGRPNISIASSRARARPKRRDRVSLGARPIRSSTGNGGRAREPRGGRAY
jgi:hypothetical protein